MTIKAVLFDLDGTLLPMDQDLFTKGYFKLLAKKLAPLGYLPEELTAAIWKGTGAMVRNDGQRRNEEAFWNAFSQTYGEDVRKDEPVFNEFYGNEFQQAKECCGYNPKAAEAVRTIKEMGFRTALATNPIFPAIATESRIRWTGLEPEEFEFYTTYEDIGYCKPNPNYYMEVAKRIGLKPEECLMVGNDVTEDMVAETIGMQVFLLTDCMINREDKDISAFRHGSFPELIETMAQIKRDAAK